MRRMCEIADEFRRRGQLVAIGGPYAVLSPHVVRPHADILFRGEAEHTWPAFLEDFLERPLADGVREPRDGRSSDSPVPDISTLRPGGVRAGRGADQSRLPVRVRVLRRDRVSRSQASATRPRSGWSRSWSSCIRPAIARCSCPTTTSPPIASARPKPCPRSATGTEPSREPVALYTQLSIDVTRDRDLPLLDLCAEAGLKQAFVGIETPNADALREVHKRQNLRVDLVEDVHRIQRRGIMVQAGMITGFDSDTLESFAAQYRVPAGGGHPDGPAGDAECARRHAVAASPGRLKIASNGCCWPTRRSTPT